MAVKSCFSSSCSGGSSGSPTVCAAGDEGGWAVEVAVSTRNVPEDSSVLGEAVLVLAKEVDESGVGAGDVIGPDDVVVVAFGEPLSVAESPFGIDVLVPSVDVEC